MGVNMGFEIFLWISLAKCEKADWTRWSVVGVHVCFDGALVEISWEFITAYLTYSKQNKEIHNLLLRLYFCSLQNTSLLMLHWIINLVRIRQMFVMLMITIVIHICVNATFWHFLFQKLIIIFMIQKVLGIIIKILIGIWNIRWNDNLQSIYQYVETMPRLYGCHDWVRECTGLLGLWFDHNLVAFYLAF